MNQKLENIILERYLRLAVGNIDGVIYKSNYFNFKCNVCGDSKKKTGKKRGFLLLGRKDANSPEHWVYKCFNEGECEASGYGSAWSAVSWLKKYYPHLYRRFQRELIENNQDTSKKKLESQIKKQKEIIEKKQSIENNEKAKREKHNVKYFIPILNNNELSLKAVDFCLKRKIPEEIWKQFFVCIDGDYKGRMIIPFYDNRNNIYYFQARSLVGHSNKYINRTKNKDNGIFNIYNIDRTKPVIVTEGPIDSMFIENSIATLGLEISESQKNLLGDFDCYYLFDNDVAGKGLSKKYIKKGESVFNWSKFKYYDPQLSKQDINEVYVKNNLQKKFTFGDLKNCFTNNYYDSIYF